MKTRSANSIPTQECTRDDHRLMPSPEPNGSRACRPPPLCLYPCRHPRAASRSTIKKAQSLSCKTYKYTLKSQTQPSPPISSTMDRDKPIMKITKQLETSLSEIP